MHGGLIWHDLIRKSESLCFLVCKKYHGKVKLMQAVKKKVFTLMFGLGLILGAGCAPSLVSISIPEIQTIENSHYIAKFEPLSEGKNYFDSFRLTVINKTPKDLEIDWNKTRYLYNGRDGGVFVFKGIEPEKIKNLTIPPDTIPAGQSLTKDISPSKLVARAPLAGKGSEAGKIAFGIIPAGESGIFLSVRQNGNTIKEKITVKITKKEVQQ